MTIDFPYLHLHVHKYIIINHISLVIFFAIFQVAAEEVDLTSIRVVVIVPELTMKKSLFSKEPTKNCQVNVKPNAR